MDKTVDMAAIVDESQRKEENFNWVKRIVYLRILPLLTYLLSNIILAIVVGSSFYLYKP